MQGYIVTQHSAKVDIYISTFNMFIIIHEIVDIIAEMKQSGVLIF